MNIMYSKLWSVDATRKYVHVDTSKS